MSYDVPRRTRWSVAQAKLHMLKRMAVVYAVAGPHPLFSRLSAWHPCRSGTLACCGLQG